MKTSYWIEALVPSQHREGLLVWLELGDEKPWQLNSAMAFRVCSLYKSLLSKVSGEVGIYDSLRAAEEEIERLEKRVNA